MNRKEFLRLVSAAGAAGVAGIAGVGCAPASTASAGQTARKYGAWVGGYETADKWKVALDRLSKAGLNTILPGASDAETRMMIPLARERGMEVHSWRVQMRSDAMIKQHPEWYAVSRNGVSTAVKPPYVGYYQFMCPSRPEVREWVVGRALETARIDGIASVHLDYIRLPDVILPIALWPKYNIVQDREYPDYDFCYCEVCRDGFRRQTGLDPLKLSDPPSNAAWLKFRWDAITGIVNSICDAVHKEGKRVSAAVFPTPEIARALVRQDWVKWNVDAVMPMIYNGFYNEPVSWIRTATLLGTKALQGRIPLYTGVYIPDLKPAELEEAVHLALDAGAAGVMIFDATALSDEHLAAFARAVGA